MQWIDEPDYKDRTATNHALILEPDEPLLPAFAMFWRRLLADGCAKAASGWTSLSVEIADRQIEEDEPGYVRAVYRSFGQRACRGIGAYYIRGDAFTCLQLAGEDNLTFNRKQISWFLQQYELLKQAALAPEIRELLRAVTAIRPLPIRAATAFGWFDLQLGQDAFGALPTEDQQMLLGLDPPPADPPQDLLSGVIELDVSNVLAELGEALIACAPPYFETICCEIREGFEDGQRALFYDIQFPQFPDDGTSVVSDRVHRAATRLVLHMTQADDAFPGIVIRLERQPDGSWLHSLRPPSDAAASTIH